MARTEGTAHHMQAWPDETTINEVMKYATREFSNHLILLVGAERSQDSEQMNIQVKAMRTVVTRLDAFRRLRVRQWRLPQESSQTNTSPQAASEK